MQNTTAYVLGGMTTLVLLLTASLIANAINFEQGSRPKDPARRKAWFWILAVLNPTVTFLLGYFIFKPEANIMVIKRYINALSLSTAIAFVTYIGLGFLLSRIFRNGKIGHWF
ncbi:hypothetical protein LLH06_10775 [Mucilaginibacter daejeonensis]|uniref:hypothetical protein n=1 Tax=Mucilaginibacter daejeonensis TaxID=398049 RepID=UPI001D1786A5|nr:hypothetical protein [Mucilaginibacter daejeonensis]UEG51457.1 hypothetical protein LLH06_10775 [Mucilaginibacter daejeonensis]